MAWSFDARHLNRSPRRRKVQHKSNGARVLDLENKCNKNNKLNIFTEVR